MSKQNPFFTAKLQLDVGLGIGRTWVRDDGGPPNEAMLFEGKDYEAKQIHTLLTEAFKNFQENRS